MIVSHYCLIAKAYGSFNIYIPRYLSPRLLRYLRIYSKSAITIPQNNQCMPAFPDEIFIGLGKIIAFIRLRQNTL
jgi:hypothetical protein